MESHTLVSWLRGADICPTKGNKSLVGKLPLPCIRRLCAVVERQSPRRRQAMGGRTGLRQGGGPVQRGPKVAAQGKHGIMVMGWRHCSHHTMP
jgi:hypothetical protein